MDGHGEPWVGGELDLEDADVVVSHGGSGTVIAALAFGIPQVVLPLGADQPLNADRCIALRVGIVLNALDCTPTAVGEATSTLLRSGGETYRVRAREVRAEIASLPDARYAATLFERVRAGNPERVVSCTNALGQDGSGTSGRWSSGSVLPVVGVRPVNVVRDSRARPPSALVTVAIEYSAPTSPLRRMPPQADRM